MRSILSFILTVIVTILSFFLGVVIFKWIFGKKTIKAEITTDWDSSCKYISTDSKSFKPCGSEPPEPPQSTRKPTITAPQQINKTFPAKQVKTTKLLTDNELTIRILGPLKTKGKLGRNHTTPIENLYKSIPSHQIGESKGLITNFMKNGYLNEKNSNGNRHVWLTEDGLKKLDSCS